MARSRSFHWVLVNRDRTPEITKRFRVSAHPSILVLGREHENIHRFHGFRPPERFLPELDEGLRRYALYQAGKEWDAPVERTLPLTGIGRVRTLPAPSFKVPSGIVMLGGDLWVAQQDELFCIEPKYGAHKRTLKLRPGTQDIATDGELLYAVDAAWSDGSPIQVLDPKTGRQVRAIVTGANAGKKRYTSRGIAWREGSLWVLGIYGKLHEIDPGSGVVLRTLDTKKRWTFGLAFDGRYLVAGSRDALLLVDPKDGRIAREIPVNYRLRAVGYHGGEYFCMAQPEWGFDRRHERIQAWPRPGRTMIYRVRLPN